MGRKLTLIAAAAIAFGMSAVAAQVISGSGTPVAALAHAASGPTVAASTTYSSLLDSVDRRIDGLQTRVNARADDWLTRMHLGTVLLERASLTHEIEDFERVQAVLDESFAIAPRGAGPLLLAARFNFTIHRLDIAQRYLDQMDARAMQRREEQVAAQVLRAEIAFQRGQYDVALQGLEQVAAAMPAVAASPLALQYAKTGDVAQAEALLEDALASTTAKDPQRRAWTRVQLGVLALDRGAPLLALEHLQAADAELPGWWLVQEHLAEAHDRLGAHGRARAIRTTLVETSGLPQHMDLLAAAYQHAGEQTKADDLVARAATRWDEQLARLPEAAMGHGVQHHLQFGTAARALELAQANDAVRPGGEAKVLLAKAWLRSDRPDEALRATERALATPYRTAALHDVASQAYAALGHDLEAQTQLLLRDAINPSYQPDQHTH